MTAPIISEAVFNKMDKNKDGFISKGNIVLCVLNTFIIQCGKKGNIDHQKDIYLIESMFYL